MNGMRRTWSLVAILTLAAGCSGPEPSASPTSHASPSAIATLPAGGPSVAAVSPEPTPTAVPTSSATPTPEPTHRAASWKGAGTMVWPRRDPTAVVLGDGRVLVLGDTGGKYEAVPEHSRKAELWDPQTRAWRATDALPKARGSFAAVTLKDGRVLVAGGVNDTWYSYSSAYVFDPASEQWTKVGLMGTARSAPAAVVLRDGRVLVAGGTYDSGVKAIGARTGDIRLASTGQTADTWPGPDSRPLATAELFDPASGTWSPTGSMHYARAGLSAVPLADGRILIASDGWGGESTGGMTAEMYDPATGRFDLTGDLPAAVDPTLFDDLRVPGAFRCANAAPLRGGTLVAQADGDAALLDSEWSCASHDPSLAGVTLTRTFRLDADTGRWVETGLTTVRAGHDNEDGTYVEDSWGDHPNGIIVPLSTEQVLFAGGSGTDQLGIRTAELYDLATGRWAPQPKMPSARMTAEGVVLTDGSVLIIGGYSDGSDGYPISLGDTFRFVPAT